MCRRNCHLARRQCTTQQREDKDSSLAYKYNLDLMVLQTRLIFFERAFFEFEIERLNMNKGLGVVQLLSRLGLNLNDKYLMTTYCALHKTQSVKKRKEKRVKQPSSEC